MKRGTIMQQTYTIKMQNSFNLNHIFDCGQCFRWKKQDDESYTGVFKNNVLNLKKENDTIIFTGMCEGSIKDIVNDYFDLNTNYEIIKANLSKIDTYLAQSIEYGEGK
jgi:N-glycosylase/DNA lyase